MVDSKAVSQNIYIYNLLVSCIPNNFGELFKRRFEVLGLESGLDEQFAVNSFADTSSNLKRLLRPLHRQSALALIRTWTN